MSSSPQKEQVSSYERNPLGQGPFPCPECGQIKLVWVTGDCTLLDGSVVPNIRRLQCSSCKEDFFDHNAMSVIEAYRRKTSKKEVNIQKRRKYDTEII